MKNNVSTFSVFNLFRKDPKITQDVKFYDCFIDYMRIQYEHFRISHDKL